MPPTLSFPLGRSGSQPNTTQKASWSVHPFLHGSRLYPADRQTDQATSIAISHMLAYRCGLEIYKILGKMTVMGLSDIKNSNSNKNKKKTKNKMYTPHHTISHKHTHTPQEWKTSKNRRKFIANRQTLVYITRTPASTSRRSPSVEKNTQSNVHAYFPFLHPFHVLFNVHWLERTRHHPAGVTIPSHSVSLHTK